MFHLGTNFRKLVAFFDPNFTAILFSLAPQYVG